MSRRGGGSALSLGFVLALSSLGFASRCGFAATPSRSPADAKLATWTVTGKKAVPVYPATAKQEQPAGESKPEISIGSPMGKPLFFLQPGATADVVDVFQTSREPESEYICKIRTHDLKTGFVPCDSEAMKWTGDRGSIVRIVLEEPYEYEGDPGLAAEVIKRFQAYVDQYPSGRFVAFAKLKILWLRYYILQSLEQDLPADLQGLKERGELFGEEEKVDIQWTPEANRLYAALQKKKQPSSDTDTAFPLVDELLKAVPSPINKAH